MGVGLVALPFIIWFGMHTVLGTVMAVIPGLIIGAKFLPTAKKALGRAKTTRGFLFDRGRGDQ
jgi:hypothetical protein